MSVLPFSGVCKWVWIYLALAHCLVQFYFKVFFNEKSCGLWNILLQSISYCQLRQRMRFAKTIPVKWSAWYIVVGLLKTSQNLNERRLCFVVNKALFWTEIFNIIFGYLPDLCNNIEHIRMIYFLKDRVL